MVNGPLKAGTEPSLLGRKSALNGLVALPDAR
jgi:hypothetical protein